MADQGFSSKVTLTVVDGTPPGTAAAVKIWLGAIITATPPPPPPVRRHSRVSVALIPMRVGVPQ